MVACGSAHHWVRWLNGMEIEVKLLPAIYNSAYVKRDKTVVADACTLPEPARCADIAPVKIKYIEQQALPGLHRSRLIRRTTVHKYELWVACPSSARIRRQKLRKNRVGAKRECMGKMSLLQ